jgi:hypothetical protein
MAILMGDKIGRASVGDPTSDYEFGQVRRIGGLPLADELAVEFAGVGANYFTWLGLTSGATVLEVLAGEIGSPPSPP